MTRRLAIAVATLALVGVPACSEDLTSSPTSPPATTPPESTPPASSPATTVAPADLEPLLLRAEDIADDWQIATDVTPQDFEIGAERCNNQAINPTIVQRLQPSIGRILVGPIGWASVREMLVTGEPSRLALDVRAFVEGTRPCLGRTETSTDGEQLTYGPLALPALGDEAFAMSITVAEPPTFDRTWTIRMAGVLVDDVFVVIDQIEPVTTASGPTFTEAQFVDVVERAVELVGAG